MGLSEEEQRMLRFEKQWWRDQGAKAEEIRHQFDMSPIAYFYRLSVLLDKPEALDYDPVLVRRLLRRRQGTTSGCQ